MRGRGMQWSADEAGSVTVRSALREDLPTLAALLRDDDIEAERRGPALEGESEGTVDSDLLRAWASIEASPHVEVWVVDVEGVVVAVAQLVFIPALNWGGALRVQLQSVRVARAYRGQGLGTDFLRWLMERARSRGASVAQLSSDRRRVDAHRWYAGQGFEASHIGFRRVLAPMTDADA